MLRIKVSLHIKYHRLSQIEPIEFGFIGKHVNVAFPYATTLNVYRYVIHLVFDKNRLNIPLDSIIMHFLCRNDTHVTFLKLDCKFHLIKTTMRPDVGQNSLLASPRRQ